VADAHVQAVRRFNKFYARRIGMLGEGELNSPYSLTEVRVLNELAHRDQPTATEISRDLEVDPGYLSRILHTFQKRGWIAREPSAIDRRQHHIVLTGLGRQALTPLDRNAGDAVAGLLKSLTAGDQNRLLFAMGTIENLLGARGEAAPGYTLRPHRPGDIGWVIHRHGALYAEEYGWDGRFECLVAEIAAAFLKNFDPTCERCWIAERNGGIVGSVFLVRGPGDAAKLRLLLVEPEARGLGIGKRLVAECIGFAKEKGYRKIVLWTQSNLLAARRIYQAAGFQLTGEEPHADFGVELVSQTWELAI
jgi:DNA-binding MarR family transcriptional regulator/GNAT superfamily N-acetyltransferase